MTERQQARLLEQYILALQASLNAQPPQALDSEMAKFARQVVMSRQASPLDYVTRSRIWEQALDSLNEKEQIKMIQTHIQAKPRFSSTWGAMVALLLIVGVVGGMMMFSLNNHSPNNYLSVYPMATHTEVPTELFSDIDRAYITATAFIEQATERAISTMFEASLNDPTFMVTLPPDLNLLATATPLGMLSQDQAGLINAQCQYIDLLSAECAYRLGQQFRAFGFEGYIPTAKEYLRQAYDLDPDNDEYRYGLAQILFETGDCLESKQLLMPDILNDAFVSHDALQILAQYAVSCEEEILLSSGLNIIYPTRVPELMVTSTPIMLTDDAVVLPTMEMIPPTVVPQTSSEEIDFGDLCMNVPATSAECYYLKSLFIYWMNGEQHSDESIAYLSEALVYQPDSLNYRYHLALALAETGQCEASKRLLLAQDIDEHVMLVIGRFNEQCGLLQIPDGFNVIDSSQTTPTDEPVLPTSTITAVSTPTAMPTSSN
jgi:tetratricopeptide (TPR) repeat protein